MHAQHAADPDRVETPVMDQPTDRLRVNAELACDLAYAHQSWRDLLLPKTQS